MTASGQSGKPAGGQVEPPGGERAKRYASERWRITSVIASRSGGQSSTSRPIMVPASACQSDAGVGCWLTASMVVMSVPGRPDGVGGDDHLAGVIAGLDLLQAVVGAGGSTACAPAGVSAKL